MTTTFSTDWTAADDGAFDAMVEEGRLEAEAVSAVQSPVRDEEWESRFSEDAARRSAQTAARRKLILVLLFLVVTIGLLVLLGNAAGASAAGHCGGL